MPVLDRNRRPYVFPKGSKTVATVTHGHHPVEALLKTVDEFEEEHGTTLEQDERCFITIAFSTFETVCEIIQFPEEYGR